MIRACGEMIAQGGHAPKNYVFQMIDR